MQQGEQMAETKRLALRLVTGGRREYQPLSGAELLCQAARAAEEVMRRGLARVPVSDPLRPEIESRVARLPVPGEPALPVRG